MDRKSISFFIVGLVTGVLAATAGFSALLRSKNIAKENQMYKTSNQDSQDNQDKQNNNVNKIVLKLSHGLDQKHPVHIAMEFMAKRLKELSDGKVELQVFPSGQLGNETDNIAQLQRGALAMTKTSAAPMESFIPEMAVFSIPYIFRNETHYWNVLDSPLGKEMLKLGDAKGLHGLCYYDSGSRNFYTIKKPVLTPDDLKGLKIRVMNSRTSMDMVEALGGQPTPIPWGELYTALQQGLVDGAENNPPSFYTNRHYEVCKYFSFDEHTRIPDILMISTKVWSRLSPEVRKWVQQAADDSSKFQRKLWKEKTTEAVEEVKKFGVKIYYPDKKPFVEKVRKMHKRYEGTKIGELLKKIAETE